MRKRNKAITIRMNESEFNAVQARILESGTTQQAYIINAALGAVITPTEEITALKDISRTFASHDRQLRGLATNVNQMAHATNAQGSIPSSNELSRITSIIAEYRKESGKIWQSIRSLTAGRKVTQD